MQVEVKYKSDYEYISTDSLGNDILIDMTPEGKKKSQNPTELLLSACASCSMVDIALILKKRKKTFSDFRAFVKGERKNEHPKHFSDIHIVYQCTSQNVQKSELEKLVDLAVNKYCSVISSLRQDIHLTWGVEVKES